MTDAWKGSLKSITLDMPWLASLADPFNAAVHAGMKTTSDVNVTVEVESMEMKPREGSVKGVQCAVLERVVVAAGHICRLSIAIEGGG